MFALGALKGGGGFTPKSRFRGICFFGGVKGVADEITMGASCVVGHMMDVKSSGAPSKHCYSAAEKGLSLFPPFYEMHSVIIEFFIPNSTRDTIS